MELLRCNEVAFLATLTVPHKIYLSNSVNFYVTLYTEDLYLICLRTLALKQTPELSVVCILAPGSDLIVPLALSAERMLSIDPFAEAGRAPLVEVVVAAVCLVRAGGVRVDPDCAVNVAYPPRSMLLLVAEPGLS